MKYLIGMDGGGTKTKCVLTDFSLNKIYETAGSASNFLVIGAETVSETMLNLINDCATSQKISIDDIEAIVLGTTGGGRRNDAELLENQIFADAKQKSIPINKFRVESDA
ncbi:MAG TPA: BadF/BadG/BcrA/BcrD ATPase family protein, partial [Ignavibacteriaceae bacterium]